MLTLIINIQVIKEEFMKEFPEEVKAKVWEESGEAMRTHYDEMVGRWQAAMDSVLVYVSHYAEQS